MFCKNTTTYYAIRWLLSSFHFQNALRDLLSTHTLGIYSHTHQLLFFVIYFFPFHTSIKFFRLAFVHDMLQFSFNIPSSPCIFHFFSRLIFFVADKKNEGNAKHNEYIIFNATNPTTIGRAFIIIYHMHRVPN